MRKYFYRFYLRILFCELYLRHLIFGFENLNNRIQNIEQTLIVKTLVYFGANVGKDVEIESPIIFNVKKNYSNLTIADNTYIGKNVLIDLKGKVSIGASTTVSMNSVILGHMDSGKNCKLKAFYPAQFSGCTIGDHCYIGAGSILLPGIELSNYALVAAGSVVAKNVDSYTMVGGVPARYIKRIQKV